ncbi:MAG: glycogen/starch/alpha-glucan phosphorylase, partial [Oscillospiraceae bacterium]|nr:glycogen/starch/alpha-glucan phosphorylase [Oscillospiraceae bacterium]
IFIFGMRTPEVEDLAAKGYDPQEVLAKDPGLASLIDRIANGGVNGLRFDAIVNNLRYQDPYMTLADFRSYQATQQLAGETYENRTKWQKMSLINTAHAGLFAADRSVRDYAENIWHTKSILD